MPRGDKNPYKGDLKKLDTRGMARSTSPESIEAGRKLAAGGPAPPYDPAEHARLGRHIEDVAKRTVVGRYETKGRSPTYTLSPDQFAQHQATGEWEGMPTIEQYGPQHQVAEDKEYEP
jgi:hypothetical protein